MTQSIRYYCCYCGCEIEPGTAFCCRPDVYYLWEVSDGSVEATEASQ